jgi:hypothetical protein
MVPVLISVRGLVRALVRPEGSGKFKISLHRVLEESVFQFAMNLHSHPLFYYTLFSSLHLSCLPRENVRQTVIFFYIFPPAFCHLRTRKCKEK